MKIFSQHEAVKMTVKLLKDKGFHFTSRSENSYYLLRHRCKVRVSDHSAFHGEDCDVEIIYTDHTILNDINYRVEKINGTR